MRISDWSADVCSSDLRPRITLGQGFVEAALQDVLRDAMGRKHRMGGAPAGLCRAAARVVVAREEVEPVHELVQSVVEGDRVVPEDVLQERQGGGEGKSV